MRSMTIAGDFTEHSRDYLAMTVLLASSGINTPVILAGLFGGLAIFLFGMTQMTDSLKMVAGDRMRLLLSKLTRNRFAAAFTGAFVTAVCQSSSVTTVLLVGFISAGLMTMTQSVGVIMGANIGSTVTAQLIAFKVTALALPMVTVGFALQFLGRRELARHLGGMILGLGLVFHGMALMSDATTPLRSHQPFIDAMQNMDNPLLAILVSAVFTAVIQSSAATTGIVIVLASQSLITLEAGIALAMGANIGTCATAILAAIGKPRPAVQAATVHVLFNLAGVLIWLPVLGSFAEVVRMLPGESPARQIANAHTLFNVVNTLIFIWFTAPIAQIVAWLVPEKSKAVVPRIEPEFLDDIYLDTPGLALDRVHLELDRVGGLVLAMLDATPQALHEGSLQDLNHVRRMDDDVDTLHAAVLAYLRQLAARELSEAESHRMEAMLEVANYLESTGDLIETNFVAQGQRRIEYGLRFSSGTRDVFQSLHERVATELTRALRAWAEDEIDEAEDVVADKGDIDQLATAAFERVSRRLLVDEPNRIEVFRVESDIINQYKRVYYYAKRIAKVLIRETSEIKDAA